MEEAVIIVVIGLVVFCAINPFRAVGPIGGLFYAALGAGMALAEAEVREVELRKRQEAKVRAAMAKLERGNE